MLSKIKSILTVGVAALILAVPVISHAADLTSNEKKKIASLKKSLGNLPKHKAIFSKINSYVNQLVKLDPKNANAYLNTALTKIALPGASKSASRLVNSTNQKVKVAVKTLSKKQINSIINKNNRSLQRYVPPGPNNPPYQAALSAQQVVA